MVQAATRSRAGSGPAAPGVEASSARALKVRSRRLLETTNNDDSAMAAAASGAQGTNPVLGDVLSLLVSFWYSGYFLAVKLARRDAGAMRVTWWATLVGAPILLVVSLMLGEDLVPASAAGWSACVAMGLMHVTGQGGVAWALGKLPASLTAVTILIQPVVAGVLGWLVFGETLTPIQALGGALVLGAVVLAQVSARKKTGAPAKADAPVNP
mgnify:CR=1 FL=1